MDRNLKIEQALTNSLTGYMLHSAHELYGGVISQEPILKDFKDDLTEAEALSLADELMNVLIKHNLSYKNSYRVVLALAAGLASGAMDLYNYEKENDIR